MPASSSAVTRRTMVSHLAYDACRDRLRSLLEIHEFVGDTLGIEPGSRLLHSVAIHDAVELDHAIDNATSRNAGGTAAGAGVQPAPAFVLRRRLAGADISRAFYAPRSTPSVRDRLAVGRRSRVRALAPGNCGSHRPRQHLCGC